VDIEAVRQLSAYRLAAAIRAVGVRPGWVVADAVVAATSQEEPPGIGDPAPGRVQPFQNLVVGTIAERVFRERDLALQEARGFTVIDYHERGENRDYGLQRDGVELPINVKVASTLFRNAESVVGLAPEDCVPISAYKALGASERAPGLVYADLVDFTLRERVDSFMESLDDEDFLIGWHLLSWFAGPGARRAQDQYVAALFARYGQDLMALAPGAANFRVISAQRVLSVMRANPRRVPGLGVRGAGTGAFVNGQVAVLAGGHGKSSPLGV